MKAGIGRRHGTSPAASARARRDSRATTPSRRYSPKLRISARRIVTSDSISSCARIALGVGTEGTEAMDQVAPHPRIGAVLQERPDLRRLVHSKKATAAFACRFASFSLASS